MRIRWWVLLSLAVVIVVALSVRAVSDPAVSLPDRSDPQVAAEEARLAEVAAGQTWVTQPTCDVRLLRQEEETSWVWAYCLGQGGQGESLPLRIDGTEISRPGSGSQYGPDIEALFPPDLADYVIDRERDLVEEVSLGP